MTICLIAGSLAGCLLLGLLVLIAIDGHPEGLAAAAAGALVPLVIIWLMKQLTKKTRK